MIKKIRNFYKFQHEILGFIDSENRPAKMVTNYNLYSFSVWQKFIDHPYSRLCRYNAPIGCMLLYWPVTWGLAIGAATFPRIVRII